MAFGRLTVLLLGPLVLGACGGGETPVPPADRARAVEITDAADLIGGPKAAGRVGDFLLANTKVRFIVAAGGRTRAWLPVGGALLDADRVRDGAGDDRLQEMVTRLGPLRVLYAESVEVANDGSDGKAAVVRVTGHDIGVPVVQAAAALPPVNVTAVTEYRLAPYAESLEITTTVRGGGGGGLQVGDAFVLGDVVTQFAPGYGTDAADFSMADDLRFFAGFGGTVAYGYVAPGRMLSVFQVPGESKVFALGTDRLNIPDGGTATFTRYLAVGEGDVAGLLPEIVRRERGDPEELVTVSGTVSEQHTGAAVAGAQVELTDERGPYAIAVTGADGRYRAPLEPGRYGYAVSARGRVGPSTGDLDVAGAEPPPLDLQVDDTGRFAVAIDDAAGGPCPARLRFSTTDGAGAGYFLSGDGRGEGLLAPGDYHAVVSRGYEWEAAEVPFTVTAGETTTIAAVLERAVDTTGFVAIDSHTHTAVSIDSSLDPRERVAHALADGVELVVTTEHDAIFDLGPVTADLGLEGDFATAMGIEISPIKGHLNAYPVALGPTADTDGYWPVKWWSEDARHDYVDMLWPAEIFQAARDKIGAQVIQLNHPRSATIGILYWVDYDPTRGLETVDPAHFDMSWDVIEVCNSGCDGSPDSEDSASLRDYYSFLNQGFVRGAVGVSDNHGSSGFLGRARTMVEVPDDDPAYLDLDAVWASLKAGRAVVLDGPFVTLTVRDDGGAAVGPGGLATVTGSAVALHVTVQAPGWIPADRLTIVGNGVEVAVVPIAAGDPLPAGRFDADVPVGSPVADTWYVAIVDGLSDMAPVMPGHLPRSITNAVFVDRDGDGSFTAPGL